MGEYAYSVSILAQDNHIFQIRFTRSSACAMSQHVNFNPFVAMGCADMDLEDALNMSLAEWRHRYRQRALELHPDKTSTSSRHATSHGMTDLTNAKDYLCKSSEIAVMSSYQFLRSRKEKAQALASEMEKVARASVKDRLPSDTSQRSEALPGVALMQGHLPQMLASAAAARTN